MFSSGRLAAAVGSVFGAVPAGNWESGRNVLWVPNSEQPVAPEIRRRLFEAREVRIRPGTDDKILTAWNGLAIAALAEGGRALGEQAYVEAAMGAFRFFQRHLVVDGRVQRAWRAGRVSGPGYLDDHALMATGALCLYEATFDLDVMRTARSLADDVIRLFQDEGRGGFFQTGSDAEALVIRPKELSDNAMPSGNSSAAEVLLRLAHFTGDDRYERAGASALRVAAPLVTRAPSAFGHALGALDLYLSDAKEVAIAGDPDAGDTRALVGVVWGRYAPNLVLAAGRPGDAEAAAAVPLLAGRQAMDGKAAAYVCEHFTCKLPVGEPAELADQLQP